MKRLTPPRMRKVGLFYGMFIIPMALGGYMATRMMLAEPLPAYPNATLTLAQQRYEEGEVVQFVLANNEGRALRLDNDCPGEPLSVYRLYGQEWRAVSTYSSTIACDTTQTAIVVEPGARMSMSYEHWSDLFSEPGTYRIVARFQGFDGELSSQIEVIQ